MESKVEPFPLIELAGGPLERGRSYGKQAKERIHRSITHYKSQAGRASFRDEDIAAIVRDYIPKVERFEPTYIEEMRGIAEGAGVPFDDVFLLNARTEVIKLALRPDLRERFAQSDGCTSLTVMPEASRDRRLIQAQNWDWKVETAQTCVVLRIQGDNCPDILTFTEAGMLARSGFNSAGISVVANGLESDRDYSQVGVPLAFIRRKILQSDSVALAMHAVYTTPKSASNNMIVSQAGGVSIDFECAPDETFTLKPEDGLLVHANHWLSPVALSKLKDTRIAMTPCTLYRDQRVRQILAPKIGAITVDDVKQALLDDFASPWSVCRPPRKDVGRDTRSATVATIVMQPASGIMEVAALPALAPTFTTYRLPLQVHQHDQEVHA